ncbi:anti-sigma factor [Nocardioides sp. SYSU DS0663]|uniref:anti-sigma factor n=1 Tax=Nocardioides sp. SYSU DS0663 TaxID=3416445 RepID=UPI003F4B4435
MHPTAPGHPQRRADVELRVPADGAYVSVLRTTAAGLAARLDFTIDDIEDLRIAVGEASAMVLPEADPGSDMYCQFWLGGGELTLAVAVESETASSPDHQPDYQSFAWQVLTTLAANASAAAAEGRFGVVMTMAAMDLGDTLLTQGTAAGDAGGTAR